MKLKIFAVYDEAAAAYLPPFFLPQVKMAQRAFGDCANDPKHQFGANPADYTLFELGEYDDWDGEITTLPTQKNLGKALIYIQGDKPDTPFLEPTKATDLREVPA